MSLHDFAGSKNVVLYFYPKDFTMGCTTETRAFAVSHGSIAALDAEVIGISSDTAESHGRFASECGVTFPLLSDRGGKVRDLYGVKSMMGLLPGRVTFVIDKGGVVRKVFSSQMNPKGHVSMALDALASLK